MPRSSETDAAVPAVGDSLSRLKNLTARGNLTAEDVASKAKTYAEELVRGNHDARDVAAAVEAWPAEFFPNSWNLLRAAVDDAALRRRQAEAGRAQAPRRGESFVERCLRLGFHAGRLSAIGAGHWSPIFDADRQHGLSDEGVAAALRWCEEHPGRSWRAPVPNATPASVRETARLVRDMRARPQDYACAPALIDVGENLLRRHIAHGTAPADVVRDFPHLLDREEVAA